MAVPRKQTAVRILSHVIRLVLAVVFLWSGIAKVINPMQFAESVEHFKIVGPKVSLVIAYTLPWLEIVCAVTTFAMRMHRGAMLILIILNLIFVAALSSALFRGLNIACGCVGEFDRVPLWFSLLRAALMLVLTVALQILGTCGRVGAPTRATCEIS